MYADSRVGVEYTCTHAYRRMHTHTLYRFVVSLADMEAAVARQVCACVCQRGVCVCIMNTQICIHTHSYVYISRSTWWSLRHHCCAVYAGRSASTWGTQTTTRFSALSIPSRCECLCTRVYVYVSVREPERESACARERGSERE